MIRKIVSLIRKYTSPRPTRSAAHEKANLGEQEFQAQRDPSPDPGQTNDQAELDEGTVNEVVATWNLLNPP
jgi:hypothetical protein